jgi:hypothetical protein
MREARNFWMTLSLKLIIIGRYDSYSLKKEVPNNVSSVPRFNL